MTNGEKIKAMFPSMIVVFTTKLQIGICFVKNQLSATVFDLDWWNAEYKEPTTKNDLAVDCIDRAQTQTEIEMYASRYTIAKERGGMGQVEWSDQLIKVSDAVDIIRKLPSVTPQEPRWISVSERLPEDIRPVIVTWKNNDPASYYQYIVGKHFIGAAHYLKGKWYWYSSTTEDFLAEYGRYEGEEFDEAIEVIAWQPLPQPF